MALSKIQEIAPSNPPTWPGKQGQTMYAYDVTLEDGTQGAVNTMKPDRWNVGDEVEYTQHTSNYGNKLQLQKPNFNQSFRQSSGFRQSGSTDNTKEIVASWAVGVAVNVNGPVRIDNDTYWDNVKTHATQALALRKELVNLVE